MTCTIGNRCISKFAKSFLLVAIHHSILEGYIMYSFHTLRPQNPTFFLPCHGDRFSRALRPGKTCFRECFLDLPCFHDARKHRIFLACSRSKFCFLETKLTLETIICFSCGKLGNIGETCAS